MGFMRKALFVSTGGMSGLVVKANSKKERTAKAAEKQVRLQRQALKAQRSPASPATRAVSRPSLADQQMQAARQQLRGASEPAVTSLAPGYQRVILTDAGANPTATAMAISLFSNLTLKEATALTAGTPSVLAYGIRADQAADLRRDLERAGATATIDGGDQVATPALADGETATLGDLRQLAHLHERGLLTAEEFAAAKARVLAPGG